MTHETREIYKALQGRLRKHFPSLATWEMKNSEAGRHEVIRAIPNIQNDLFNWTTCEEPNCTDLKNHQRELDRVIALKVGSDASNTPWHLPSRIESSTLGSTSAQSALGLVLQMGSSGSYSPGKSVARKRKLDDVDVYDDNVRS